MGRSATGVLANRQQIAASLKLTRWLMARFHIGRKNVIGHAESLSSPYHHELVPALRTQTHGDWTAGEMVLLPQAALTTLKNAPAAAPRGRRGRRPG